MVGVHGLQRALEHAVTFAAGLYVTAADALGISPDASASFRSRPPRAGWGFPTALLEQRGDLFCCRALSWIRVEATKPGGLRVQTDALLAAQRDTEFFPGESEHDGRSDSWKTGARR
ncbi:hypothetical protein [Polyangium aurulentum]|uniref:hypothetical protein n=1 Tax=Polyangium aurulentum TaxID=2567896 RepID=UPI0010AEE1FA|nr:hypothetical protein [Polyangium aurulentum]UQA58567.1 hypothetical protein E8A73_046255 [Polyangium aurulentum]